MEKEDLDFLCEVIRFEKSIAKQCGRSAGMSPMQIKKMEMAYSRLHKKIQNYCDFLRVEIPSYEGMDYEIGLPVDPLNLEDFDEGENVFIETMLEPVIKVQGSSEIIRNGKAILGSR